MWIHGIFRDLYFADYYSFSSKGYLRMFENLDKVQDFLSTKPLHIAMIYDRGVLQPELSFSTLSALFEEGLVVFFKNLSEICVSTNTFE